MSATDAQRDALKALQSAAEAAREWRSLVPVPIPGAPVGDHAPAPPPQVMAALRRATAAFVAAGMAPAATVCEAAAAAARRMADMPALVTAEAASAVQRALIALQACAEDYQEPVPSLFPAYRAMQHLAGADRIHPADLWPMRAQWLELPAEPLLPARPPDAQARVDIEAALLELMRQPGAESCARMSDLCAALGAGQEGRMATLWQLAAAVYDAQRAQLLEPDVYLKRIGPRLLAMARGTEGVTGSLELMLRDLLYHCNEAAEQRDAGAAAGWRLRTVMDTFGLPWTPSQARAPASDREPESRRVTTLLADVVAGLPPAADLDLSDLSDWTEDRAGDAPAATSDAPVSPTPTFRPAQPAEPPATREASSALRTPQAPTELGSETDPALAPTRPPDPLETQFTALERACAVMEDALSALRRHLGATDDAFEPGSDPVIADGVRLALDAAANGVVTVARTAQALRVATDSLRKVRFDAMTGRLHEYVGRIAREQTRPVRWALYGGGELVDRLLLDKLAEPVEELLRLSVEHGIEPTQERQRAGKPAAGYVELRVSRLVDGLAIDVSDDGASLDVESLRAEALRLGVPAWAAPASAGQLGMLLSACAIAVPSSVDVSKPTLRRLAAWAQLQPALRPLGGSLELPPEVPGRSVIRVVLRD